MTEQVRHFLGSDPCAKPEPDAHAVYLASVSTDRALRQGRVLRIRTDELSAVLRRENHRMYVIAVTRSDKGGAYEHEERFCRSHQAVERWLQLSIAA